MSSIDDSARVYNPVQLGSGASIDEFSVVGKPKNGNDPATTRIGDDVRVGSHVTIYSGTQIDTEATVADYSLIGQNSKIGERSRLIYRSQVFSRVTVGEDVIIGGFLCNDSEVGDHSRIFGSAVHRHGEPHYEWGSVREPAPSIAENVFAGFYSQIIGDIQIGPRVYITAGAIVSKDVPPQSVVYGENEVVPFDQFKGELSSSEFFRQS